MSDIKQALQWFLGEDETVLNDTVRETSRRTIRQLLHRTDGGMAVYNGHLPQSSGAKAAVGNLAVTITRLGGTTFQGMSHPVGATSVILDVDIWAKSISWTKIEDLYHALRNLLVSYRGVWMAGDTEIEVRAVSMQEAFESDITPADASDGWLVNYVVPFTIGYYLAVPATGGV